MAGLTSVFFTYPLDYVHSRIAYQVKSQKYRGIRDTIALTMEEAGVKGLYRQWTKRERETEANFYLI